MNKNYKYSSSTDVSTHTKLKVDQRATASSNIRLKILMMILVLLLFGSLAALGALINLYQGKVASLHIIHEQYLSAEHEADVEMRKCEMKYQRVHELLSEKKAICEEGWRSLGLKCYFFSNDNLNWMESRASCVKKGADLVIITSQKEQDFLSSEATETCWIGLNDQETEGKWMWVNKQTLEETGVKSWYINKDGKSEPDNWMKEDPNGENCVCLGYETYFLNSWFDASCNYNRKYICQK